MTPDPKELVERLRKLAAQTVREGDAYAGPDYHNGRRLTAADTMYAAAADVIQQQAERIERLERMVTPEWYYLGDDQSSDQCRFSPSEVIDEDWNWDNPLVGGEDHIVHITTAMRGPDVWVHLHVYTEEEKDARADDEPYCLIEYATEEAARAALSTVGEKE